MNEALKKIVVTEYKGRNTCFIFNDNRAESIFFDNSSGINLGDIYVGRVAKVKEDLKACFVDFQKGITGFLPFENVFGLTLLQREFDGRLMEGDLIACQVVKEPQRGKPYFLTMKLSISGIYSVAEIDDKKLHFSAKLSKEYISLYHSRFEDLMLKTGLVVRTNAENSDIDEVISEASNLSESLDEVISNSMTRVLYTRLFSGKSAVYNRIKDINIDSYSEILTDSKEIFESLQGLNKLRLYTDSFPLKTLFSFDRAFSEATEKKVMLPYGGFLYIEPTEALTVIDVNSGKFDKKANKDEAVKQVNLLACNEIARQLVLRNLSGIIVVDFINQKGSEELLSKMNELLKNDSVKAKAIDITPLGLLEITREKKYSPLHETLK